MNPRGWKTVSQATKEIAALEDGAYGALRIRQPNVDHVIGFIKKDGAVVFVDTRSGTLVTLHPSLEARFGDAIR